MWIEEFDKIDINWRQNLKIYIYSYIYLFVVFFYALKKENKEIATFCHIVPADRHAVRCLQNVTSNFYL